MNKYTGIYYSDNEIKITRSKIIDGVNGCDKDRLEFMIHKSWLPHIIDIIADYKFTCEEHTKYDVCVGVYLKPNFEKF